ncbi:hypothetical protein [Lampropedia cohaerens]|uniref:hypothetical protein n=1 Tax=Lampropedia cohaerens TaxID=1610491 RepID=UPI0012E375D5|nr:hypothetical protein [Lampropedia cohaerens]
MPVTEPSSSCSGKYTAIVEQLLRITARHWRLPAGARGAASAPRRCGAATASHSWQALLSRAC